MNKKTTQAIALMLSIVAVAASLGSLYLSWQTQKSATPSSAIESETTADKRYNKNMFNRSYMDMEWYMFDIAIDESLLPIGALDGEHDDSTKEYYTKLGIGVREESKYRGWNYCDLPFGWSVKKGLEGVTAAEMGRKTLACYNELNRMMFEVVFLFGREEFNLYMNVYG